MAKLQINDVKLDGAELFNDSETFLNELQDGEIEQVVGGLTRVAPEHVTTTAYFPDKPYRTVYIPKEPIHPRLPVHPKEPVHPRQPIKFPYFPHPQTPVIL
ncbi:hypothetical protein Riv7116_0195 [Rivularia sp. PCC 7116]|uniref:hypothetical protein n=1 Tax=Rivularia sp. PCC 7116 TaxID=373994 RepID=UPI00029F1465|nr:hypothetical protein [Rivularia sp. PCC 7116]AFY52803.1 hypothetical protein Riv7116_0195 [Rivularia sp. PCC 7116]